MAYLLIPCVSFNSRDAWHGLGHMTKETAKAEYVSAVQELDPEWKIIEHRGGGGAMLGVGVSTMCRAEEDVR